MRVPYVRPYNDRGNVCILYDVGVRVWHNRVILPGSIPGTDLFSNLNLITMTTEHVFPKHMAAQIEQQLQNSFTSETIHHPRYSTTEYLDDFGDMVARTEVYDGYDAISLTVFQPIGLDPKFFDNEIV